MHTFLNVWCSETLYGYTFEFLDNDGYKVKVQTPMGMYIQVPVACAWFHACVDVASGCVQACVHMKDDDPSVEEYGKRGRAYRDSVKLSTSIALRYTYPNGSKNPRDYKRVVQLPERT